MVNKEMAGGLVGGGTHDKRINVAIGGYVLLPKTHVPRVCLR